MTLYDLYFNTTNLQDKQLAEARLQAGKLNRIVYDYFLSHPGNHTSSEVYRAIYYSAWNGPETSVGRALTTLSGERYGICLLRKTSVQRIGEWGRPEYAYELNVK